MSVRLNNLMVLITVSCKIKIYLITIIVNKLIIINYLLSINTLKVLWKKILKNIIFTADYIFIKQNINLQTD